MSNPWNLPPQQCAALAASAEHGSSKLVARAMGISPKTVEQHLQQAKLHMGIDHRLKAVVAYDRWARSQE
jgi:DNA-binding CsgD family transcriptional regulator